MFSILLQICKKAMFSLSTFVYTTSMGVHKTNTLNLRLGSISSDTHRVWGLECSLDFPIYRLECERLAPTTNNTVQINMPLYVLSFKNLPGTLLKGHASLQAHVL